MKPLLVTQGFTTKQGKSAELIAWVRANEDRLRDTAPDGIEFVGIYGNIFASEKGTGDTWFVVGMDNYAAMDTWAAMPGTPFGDLVDEFFGFIDPDKDADGSHFILKSAAVVTVWGDEEPEAGQ